MMFRRLTKAKGLVPKNLLMNKASFVPRMQLIRTFASTTQKILKKLDF